MLLQNLLIELSEFKPYFYCGFESVEILYVAEDFSTAPGNAAIYVVDDLTIVPPACEVLITCEELLSRIPAGIPNVVLVNLRLLSEVKLRVNELLQRD